MVRLYRLLLAWLLLNMLRTILLQELLQCEARVPRMFLSNRRVGVLMPALIREYFGEMEGGQSTHLHLYHIVYDRPLTTLRILITILKNSIQRL